MSEPRDRRANVRFDAAAFIVVAVVVTARVVRLGTAPAEWYGDMSTLYEYVLEMRAGGHPPGLYLLGVGPLYPMILRPFLWLLGDSYLALKWTAVFFSLLGLALLFRFGRELAGRWVALVAVAIGGTMSWWLVFSRLGDVQALTPPLTIATMYATMLAVRSRQRWLLHALAGGLSVLGLYVYGNTFVLPVIVAVALFVAWRQRRIGAAQLAIATGGALVCALPMLVESLHETDVVFNGHTGQHFVGFRKLPAALVRGFGEALWAYVGDGDKNFRANPDGMAHIGPLLLVFTLLGIAWWLQAPRRRQGVFLLGSFLLLHLPSVLVGTAEVPSASRTVAAAPLLALFAAAGVVQVAESARRWGPRAVATVAIVSVLAIATTELHRYMSRYLPGLPYGNTGIAAAITIYANALDPTVDVYMVGVGWLESMPELKSVRYTVEHPERVFEVAPEAFDCAALRAIPQPAVLLWDFQADLPTTLLAECRDQLRSPTTITFGGKPVFRTAGLSLEP